MAARACGGHRSGGYRSRKEAVQMTRLRRVFALLIVSVIVLMLVVTLVSEEAS
jgi:cell division protein FtsL